jgi:hypothetical protein
MELIKKTIEYRSAVVDLEQKIKKIDGALVGEKLNKYNPLKHTFAKGYYIREINTPAGQFIVTKIHKEEHPFFLMKGECSVLTEDGPKRIKAPYYDITKAGTKRVIYIQTDEEGEEKVIAKDFNDPAISIETLKQLKNN